MFVLAIILSKVYHPLQTYFNSNRQYCAMSISNISIRANKYQLEHLGSTIILTLSWQMSLSYRNQFIDLQSEFLYDRDARYEIVKELVEQMCTTLNTTKVWGCSTCTSQNYIWQNKVLEYYQKHMLKKYCIFYTDTWSYIPQVPITTRKILNINLA